MAAPRRPITYECIDCGMPTVRRRAYGRPHICQPCSISRQVASIHALMSHDGPAWEAHKRNPGGRPKGYSPPKRVE